MSIKRGTDFQVGILLYLLLYYILLIIKKNEFVMYYNMNPENITDNRSHTQMVKFIRLYSYERSRIYKHIHKESRLMGLEAAGIREWEITIK
jgi:hypothetical protein